MLHVLLVALIGGNIPLLPAAWDDCDHEAIRTVTLPATRGARLEVVARAGTLRIEGKPGLHEVRVRGRACAARESRLEDLKLVSRASGDVIRIEATQPEGGLNVLPNDYAYMDLVFEVPEGMVAQVDDGSGDVFIAHLGDLRMKDGSGDLRLEDLTGSLRVEDGSGDLRVRNVRGDVTIDDGSGDTWVRGVTGTVRVLDDGSGDLNVDTAGALAVDDAGSGHLSFSRVRGRVQVPERHRR